MLQKGFPMRVRLRVIRGKPRGQAMQFSVGEFVFGRGPECHVRPNSEMISRQHCLLRVTPLGVHVRDLGSVNGTLVNGTRVLEERALHVGDVLQLGPLVLQMIPEEEADCLEHTVAEAAVLAANETVPDAPLPP
jgi:pSer/pThr/pTyr-binding forkhead associated (FHA) protein